MPRGAKRDEVATKEARDLYADLVARGYSPDVHFADERSFIGADVHEYLQGEDRTERRRQVWERDGRRCVKCGNAVTWEQMEMDHRKGGNYGRCDCLSCNRHGDGGGNLQTLCAHCHRGPRGKHA
jgi:hypothetical protein